MSKNPLPQTLPKECAKAVKICTLASPILPLPPINTFPVESFVTKANNGLDDVRVMSKSSRSELSSPNQVIPRRVLERACGFAIFTVIRAGLLISSHGGSGIVIARLDNGCKLSSLLDKFYDNFHP